MIDTFKLFNIRQKRYMNLYEKVKRKELKIYIYNRLERILKGIHLELLKAKLRDAEAQRMIQEVNK